MLVQGHEGKKSMVETSFLGGTGMVIFMRPVDKEGLPVARVKCERS